MTTPITPPAATSPTPTSSSTPSASSTTDALGNEQVFLQLLVAQIQNQDPLNPTDSTTFVTQLAQFSELEQVIGIKTDTDQLAAASQSAAASSTTPATPTGTTTTTTTTTTTPTTTPTASTAPTTSTN